MARAALDAFENRSSPGANGREGIQVICRVYADPGDVGDAIRTLKIAKVLDPYRPTARFALETWMVESALERLGYRQLTEEQQEIVVEATRRPNKVRWPAWWTVK